MEVRLLSIHAELGALMDEGLVVEEIAAGYHS